MSGAATATAVVASEMAVEAALAESFMAMAAEGMGGEIFGSLAADGLMSAAAADGFGAGAGSLASDAAGTFFGPGADLASSAATDMGMADLGMEGLSELGAGAAPSGLPNALDAPTYNLPVENSGFAPLDQANMAAKGLEAAYVDNVPVWMQQGINVGSKAKSLYNIGNTANNLLNPQTPTQFGQRNIQNQMQQPGYSPMYQPNASQTFGLGGTRNRGAGQMAKFNRGGLAAMKKAKG